MDRREFIHQTITAASVFSLPLFPSEGSSGEQNEQMFDEALAIIQDLAGRPLHSAVVRTAIASVNHIGEWGHCAMYVSLFDPGTCRLAIECMVSDRERYDDYWPFFTDADEHEDEEIKRLAPVLLRRLEAAHDSQAEGSLKLADYRSDRRSR